MALRSRLHASVALLLLVVAWLPSACLAAGVSQLNIESDDEADGAAASDAGTADNAAADQDEDVGGDDEEGEKDSLTSDSANEAGGKIVHELLPDGSFADLSGSTDDDEDDDVDVKQGSGFSVAAAKRSVVSGSLPKDYKTRQRALAKMASVLLDAKGGVTVGSGFSVDKETSHTVQKGVVQRDAPAEHADLRVELGEDAGIYTTINPLSSFTLENIDMWTPWPGLHRDINLKSDCIVLIHYQTSTETGGAHLMSRLMIDDSPIMESTSAQGYQKYATTFGLYAMQMKAGYHTVRVQYRAANGGVDVKFADGGEDWQTRALSVIVLPEAELYVNRPRWQFKLCANDIWCGWQGCSIEVDSATEMPTIAWYQSVVYGKEELLVSKLRVDGHDKKMTRSVAGNEVYAQNTGIFVDTVPPGKHLWDVKYKSKAIDNFFDPGRDWQMRALNIINLPDAETFTVSDESNFTTVAGGRWRTLKGLSKKVTLMTERYVMATYSVALTSHNNDTNATSVKSVLYVNGKEQAATRSRCGETKYCQLLGFWVGILPEGTHTFGVKYSTPSELVMEEGSPTDVRSMSVVVLGRVASEIRSLLEVGAAQVGEFPTPVPTGFDANIAAGSQGFAPRLAEISVF